MADSNSKTTVTLEVNGQQASQTLEKLREQAVRLDKEMKKMAASGDTFNLSKMKKELRSIERSIRDMESTGAHLEKVLANLGKATPNELQKALSVLKKQLNYIERGTQEWNDQIAKIKSVQNEISVMNSSMKNSIPISQRLLNSFNNWGAAVAAAALSVSGVVAAGREAVKSFAAMDEQMANTRKYTGMSVEQVNKLNEAFKNMNTRTSREALNELAQEAGRLGKTTMEDVQGYVEAADIINVALVDLGEGATQEIAKLANIFGVEKMMGTKDAMLAIGSTINVLSQNCTASKPYLVEFTQRMAGIGAQAKMSVPELVAFGAVLDANGQKSEMASSALGKLTMMLFQDPTKMATQAGLNVEKFTETMKRSTSEGLVMFLDRIKELGSEGGLSVLAPLFKDLGADGVRMSQVLATLATHIDEVKWQFGEANKAFDEATSATNEFNIFNNTTQAGLDKAKKNLHELSVQLGEKLLPVMKHVISSTNATLKILSAVVDVVIEYKGVILASAAAIATYTVATKTKIVVTKAYEAATRLATTAQQGLNTAMKENLFGLIAAAAAAAIVAIQKYIEKTREAKFAADAVAQVEKKVSDAMADEKAKIQSLQAILHNHNVSQERRLEALKELKSIVPGYNAEISKEGKIINENTEAISKYLVQLEAKMRYEAAYEKMMEQQRKIVEAKLDLDQAEIDVEKANADYKKAMAHEVGGSAGAAESARWKEARDRADAAKKVIAEAEKESKRISFIVGQASSAMNALATTSVSTTADAESAAATGSGSSSSASSDEKKDVLAGTKAARSRSEQEALLSYARQEISKKAYLQRMLEIESTYYTDSLALTGLSNEQRQELINEKTKFSVSAMEKAAKQELDAEKNRIDLLRIEKERQHNEGTITEDQYRESIYNLDIEYLDKRIEYEQKFGDAESLLTEKRIKVAKHENEQRKQITEDEKKRQENMRQIMHEVFNTGTEADDKEYNTQATLLNQVRDQLLQSAGDNEAARRDIIASSELAILELKKKYYQITEKEYQKMLNKQKKDHKKFVRWLESEEGQAVMGSANTIIDGMSSIFSELQNLIEIQVEAQTTEVESKYDALLSHAEGNKYLEVQLEKQKEEEIAAIKNEANQKMYTMQIMTAVAQGAMAAINAYSSAAAVPLVGYILGPIAAAAALTATGIQIASIKAQKEASAASGYAEGGFTKPGDKYEVAGVVHAGEWVASQELVNSPVARPLLNTLDRAQRTNTIASLRSSDVSGSITAPARLSHAISRSNTRSSDLSSVINALTKRLNEPFVTVNTITGNHGIDKAYKDYERLMKNK